LKKIQTLKLGDTFWIVLLGILSFGGAKGRFLFGLSLFDFVLVYLFLKSLKRLKIQWITIYFFAIALYGILIGFFNRFYIGHEYNSFVLELRFYLYIPMIYQIIKSLDFSDKNINKYLIVLILTYSIIYLFMLDFGSFFYTIFNEVRHEKAFDFRGRVQGPPVIFISILFFISLNIKTRYYNVFLYLFLLAVVYIKTGERTVLLINLLPIAWFIYQKRSVWMLAVLPFVASFVPLYVNKIQLKRFYDILDPMNDPAFRYRINNYSTLLFDKMPEHPYTFLTGFGIGSDYNITISGWNANHSYFLDNSFLMFLYKFGLFIAIVLLIIIYTRVLHLKRMHQLYLIVFISIPAMLSYHMVLQPAYLISYFLAIKLLTKNHENNPLLH